MHPDAVRWIGMLGDPAVTEEERKWALRELANFELAAVPALVARLQEEADPVCFEEAPVETGAMNPGPPLLRRTTVKFEVEQLLYALIDVPKAAEPPPPVDPRSLSGRLAARFEAGFESITEPMNRPKLALIHDWADWWRQHQGQELDQIQDAYRAQIQAHWDAVHAQPRSGREQ